MASESSRPVHSPRDDAERAPITPETADLGAVESGAPLGAFPCERVLAPPRDEGELGWLAHYRVLQLLGQGGMGAVFLAKDTHLQRPVALKVMLPELAADFAARERFLREARACAALKSDHVVTIYQVGQDRDIPFLAMELLSGQSLEERLHQGEPLPVAEVLRIGREVAAGLAAAHARGLIHRDVKPGNIWIEHPGGRVKLLDFGLARAAGARSTLTQTGRVVGTPEFMSPEQGRGEELDCRSDLFSLGAVLYTLCTGQIPFQGSSIMAVLTALAVDTPRPVGEINANVPPALASLISRLMEKDRTRRPATAEDVRDALASIEPNAILAIGRTPTTRVVPVPASIEPARAALRRRAWVMILAALLLVTGAVLGWLRFRPTGGTEAPSALPSGPALRIGVLHSRTGTMAVSERPVIDAVLLAVEEINARGGVLGRPVEPVVADGQSDEATFARQADRLIQQDRVCTIFGCWTSASRKAVVPVVERHDHLLIYPVQYEGVEQSSNVIYLGPVPNQQILPALRWLVGFEGKKKWFLVGSDYVFPKTANAIIREESRSRGAEVVGEEYLLLGSTDVAEVVKKIGAARPDLIVNTINGDTNVAFFRALRRAGITPDKIPTLSFSISEEELSALGPRATAGDYVAASYFQGLENEANRDFHRRFAKRYGEGRVVSSPMQAAYAGVYLWARAVEAAGSEEPRAIRQALKGQQYDAAQGTIRIEPETQHTIQVARVGRINPEGRLVEVFASPRAVEPQPFPFRSRKEWAAFLADLYKGWGGRWSNPGP